MTLLNPLNHPICFSDLKRFCVSAWTGHAPFAMYLVSVLRPRTIVELGTFTGVSYCAFCQAVKELQLDTRCYAVDTWLGDEHTGFYGADVLRDLSTYHDPLYSSFSSLIQSTFDEALAQFPDGSIDLLHIDGAHQYENVTHDFESWLPKLSPRGILLMHDILERHETFGVRKFWGELKTRFRTFEFHHEHGLGVVAAGDGVADELRELFDSSDETIAITRTCFQSLGERLMLARDAQALKQEAVELASRSRALEAEVNARDHIIAEIDGRLARAENQNAAITNSRSWRLVKLYGRAKKAVASPRVRFRRAADDISKDPGYQRWIKQYDLLRPDDRLAIANRTERFTLRPRILIVAWPHSHASVSAQTVDSLRTQLYQTWELCLLVPNRSDELLEDADSRVRLIRYEPGDDPIEAINHAVETSDAEFVGFVRIGDRLADHALYLIIEELNRLAAIDIIYADEDTIDASGERSSPHFKPDWNPDLLTSGDYINNFAAYRSSLFKRLGGLRSVYRESTLYDFALRATAQVPAFRIRHLPHVLYHRFKETNDETETQDPTALLALNDHCGRAGIAARVTNGLPGVYRVEYGISEPAPLVSLIIATRDRVDLLRKIIQGLLEETNYQKLELLIVDNQSRHAATLSYLAEISALPQVSVIRHDQPFNFSAINNLAVRASHGELVGFLNNDLEIISPDWLREMVGHAMRREIGAVGAKLYYPNDSVQHAGIILGLGNLAGYVHRRVPRAAAGHGLRLQRIQNVSAVTAACMLMRRSVFDEAGGFDEVNLPVAYNDVDLCLRIRALGYRILWTPYAELYHVESASRPSDRSHAEESRYQRECAYLKSRWRDELAHDPYYNPNLTMETEDFSLAWPPRAPKPWML